MYSSNTYIYLIQVVTDQKLFSYKYLFYCAYDYTISFTSLKYAIGLLICCPRSSTIYKLYSIPDAFGLSLIYIDNPLFLSLSLSNI